MALSETQALAVQSNTELSAFPNTARLLLLLAQDQTLQNSAPGILYSPGVAANWSPIVPGDVSTALDQLATRSQGIEFIFRPGGVTAGRTYSTWAALMAALTPVVLEPKTIYFDDSLGAVSIPAGAYDVGKMTSFVGIAPPLSGGNRVTLTMPNGVTWVHAPAVIDHLSFLYSGAGSLITCPGAVVTRTKFFNSSRAQSSGGGAIYSVGAGALLLVQFYDGCIMQSGTIVNATDPTATVEIDLFDASDIEEDTLASVVGATFNIVRSAGSGDNPTGNLDGMTQVGMPGGVLTPSQIVLIDKAAVTLYTPGAPGNWVGSAPTTVQQALDRIAAAVVAGAPGGAIP